MVGYLKHYRMKLTAKGPICVGDGQKLIKKDYALLPKKGLIAVVDIIKLYQKLRSLHKEKDFEILYLQSGMDLGSWLKNEGFSEAEIMAISRYVLDVKDVSMETEERGRRRLHEIATFIKDAKGRPYVPGSSIKGALRTAQLCFEMDRNRDFLQKSRDEFERGCFSNERISPKNFLKRETAYVERRAFGVLNKETGKYDPVRSKLSGLIVGDSYPLEVRDLILCQKVDIDIKGNEHSLPILRESLRPGTEIYFDLSIDDRCCYTIDDIFKGLELMNRAIDMHFLRNFGRSIDDSRTVWMGAGVGFPQKTLFYPLYGKDAVSRVDEVFKNTLGKRYREHKHYLDRNWQSSPHVCKCTRYEGKLYDMGRCRLEVVE